MTFRSQHKLARRRGLAPIEFVMALPFLVILSAMIYTVARANLVKGQAIQEARNEAWHNRFNGGGGSLSFSGSGGAQVLGALARRSPSTGLQTGSGSKSKGGVHYLAPASSYFFVGSVSANANHAVFSDPWDHEVFPFEAQSPPALDSRVFVFGVTGPLLQAFDDIMGALRPPHGPMEAWQKAQDAINTVQNKINELNREIQTLENLVTTLNDRLRLAIANQNETLAREIEREIDRVQSIIRKLRDAREKMTMGQNLAPQ